MNAPKHPSFYSTERDLFLVLDGGGARGTAHVAVWRALQPLVARPGEAWKKETLDDYGPECYRLTGVAGTSAGAIAAAFIAAGADACDLIDVSGKIPLCAQLGLVGHFRDIFGIRGWRRVKFFRFFLGSSSKNRARIEHLTSEMQTSGYDGLPPVPPPAREKRRTPFLKVADQPEPEPAGGADSPETRSYMATARNAVWFFPLAFAWFFLPAIFAGLIQPDVRWPVYLLVLWLALHASFIVVGKITRDIEYRRTKSNKRDYSDHLRAVLHPVASTFYAFVLTAIICSAAVTAYYWIGWPGIDPNIVVIRFPPTWHLPLFRPPEPITRGELGLATAWVACIGLYYFSIRRTMRGFFKGSLAPERIQDDIEKALRFILVHRCTGWNDQLGQFEWIEREAVNDCKRALAVQPIETPITFQQLFDATGIHLTVVAADTIENKVHTYSVVRHPNESVAKAVSASMAIPFLFRPVRDNLKLLVDGALVSSIPAWVFRRHRNRDPDCMILAARIEAESYDYWIPLLRDYRDAFAGKNILGKARFWWRHMKLSWRWPWALFINIISTGAFGARALELDASDRLESFPLWPDIGLLDFDIAPEELAGQLKELEADAQLAIVNLLWKKKRAFHEVCAAIEDAIRDKSERSSTPKDGGYIRMFWATRDGNADSVRMKLTYNFKPEEHVDDRLVMPYGTSMSAFAMQTEKSQFAGVAVLSKLQADRMNRYRAAVKWKDLEWCWAIPIQNTMAEVVGILGIESDVPLSYFDETVGAEGNRRSTIWLKPESQEIREGGKALFDAAKANNLVRGRMRVWEDRFARMMWRHFAATGI